MGIYFRYPAAFLIAALAICSSNQLHAATRKYVSLPTNGSVVGSGSAAKSGDSLIITGQPLEGEYIPSSYGGGSKGTKLPIKPKYDYSIPRTLKGMTTTLRGGVVGIGLTLGLEWMLDQVGGFIDENGRAVKRAAGCTLEGIESSECVDQGVRQTHLGLCTLNASDTYNKMHHYQYGSSQIWATTVVDYDKAMSMTGWEKVNNCTSTALGYRYSGGWPVQVRKQVSSDPVPGTGTVPLTDADFDLIEAAAAAQDSDWLKDRLREHCEGSLAPESCYEDLRTSTHLEGPSTLTEKGPTITTTGPGGTSSSTTNTHIDITYGDNYYDYRKTSTVTTTNPDGTTETETKTDPEEVTEEQEQDEDGIEYSDADMPEVEPFYQQKYPDGLAGVWQAVSSDVESSAFLGFLSSFVPNFSGSCPTFSLQFNIASWANYGTISFWNMCWIFEFIKTVLIVSAVFLARALTFGG